MSDELIKGGVTPPPADPGSIKPVSTDGRIVFEGQGKVEPADTKSDKPIAVVSWSTPAKPDNLVAAPISQQMDIKAIHRRGQMGQVVDFTVTAATGQTIMSILVDLDGLMIYNKTFISYPTYHQHGPSYAGSGSPGMHHSLTITVTSNTGDQQIFTDEWEDEI